MEKTKRPKTSVFFHIQNIPLSRKRRHEIHLAAIKRFINYSKSRKGKSSTNRHPIPFDIWNTTFVSLIGHLIFDGEIKYSGCIYTNRNRVLLNHVSVCMKPIYPFPPKKYESLPGVYKICYHNVELGIFCKSKAEELLHSIQYMKKELQRSFLCAFFDDEGSVYFIGNRRAIRGYQHNLQILYLVHLLFKNFSIESKIDKKYNEIIITRKENIEQFSREINFTKGVCINSNRSNSIWKQSLEKREIVQRALISYQK